LSSFLTVSHTTCVHTLLFFSYYIKEKIGRAASS